MTNHVVLLGDSIFDNRSYTRGQPDVVSHLRAMLPADWTATLGAVDGSTTRDVERQLLGLPTSVTSAVLSVGGNDALLNADILDKAVASTQETLRLLGERASAFEIAYVAALDRVLTRCPALTICTIYNGNLSDAEAGVARVALMVFNDAILRAAFKRGLDVIDLRSVCTEPDDYANPIEPSGQGGRKIAQAIAATLGIGREGRRLTRVHVG